MAARYNESIGDVNEDAMISPGCGTFPSCFLANEPFFTPSICRSIHHIPGIPNIIHNIAFLNSEPRGNHWRNKKYVVATQMSNGNLNRKRKIWMGRYMPAGVEETGRKGAIPDPVSCALARALVFRH